MSARALLLSLTLCACDSPPEPQPAAPPARVDTAKPQPTQPQSTQSAGPTKPAAAESAELAWDKPAAWEETKSASSMRLVTYKIPRAEGDSEDGELSVIVSGGTVEQNVERWKQQFELEGEAKESKREVGKLKVTVVELAGTQKPSSMPMMGPPEARPGWAMLAAIAETQPRAHFFKLTGPKKTVEAAKADFDALVGSLRAK